MAAIGMALVCFASCASATMQDTNTHPAKKLDSIAWIQQPNASTCGAANVQMVMRYYFSQSEDIFTIFDEIADTSSMGRRVNRSYKIGKYLEKNHLNVSIIRFTDLETILAYCEYYQVPAIMNIQTTRNKLYGHYVLFIQHIPHEEFVKIRDPNDRFRRWIHYDDLQNSFIKTSPKSEVGGNIMILARNTANSTRNYPCAQCKNVNRVDTELTKAIRGIFCTQCGRFRRV